MRPVILLCAVQFAAEPDRKDRQRARGGEKQRRRAEAVDHQRAGEHARGLADENR